MRWFWRKDKDIPADVLALGGLGVVGTDVLDELADGARCEFSEQTIGVISNMAGQPLQKALLVEAARRREIERRLAEGDTLVVGTSYPVAAKRAMGATIRTGRICYGGVEGVPAMYPEVDVLYELYQSGYSAKLNGLARLDPELVTEVFPAFAESETLRTITRATRGRG